MDLDVIVKMNSALISAAPIPPSSKVPFTEEEIQALWAISEREWVDSVLFLLYTGFRISEMLTLENNNVDLDQMVMKGGIKTKAGKDRLVPIHPKIKAFVQKHKEEGNRFLFSYKGRKMSPSQYYVFWNDIMEQLHTHHTPHECRHTFRSRLDSAGANKVCIDLMMGHKSKEVGERVYTHKTVQELTDAICLLN